jgi:hypothetical protein
MEMFTPQTISMSSCNVEVMQYSNKGPLFIIKDKITGDEVARAWFDFQTSKWNTR